MFQDTPRSSSPINNEKNTTFGKSQLSTAFSFPAGGGDDLFQETGDSTRSLLAPIYSKQEKATLDISSSIKTPRNHSKNSFSDERVALVTGGKSTPEDTGKENAINQHNSDGTDNLQEEKNKSTKERSSSVEKNTQEEKSNNAHNTTMTTDSSFASSSNDNQTTSSSTSSLNNVSLDEMIDLKGKTWDDWFLEKAMFEMKRIKLINVKKKELDKKRSQEREEKMKREMQAAENRQDWMKRKKFQTKKKRREELAQKEFQRLKEKQEKDLLEEKAKQNYDEWYEKKKGHEKEARLRKKHERNLEEERIQEKQQQADNAYKRWMSQTDEQSKPFRYHGGGRVSKKKNLYSSPDPTFTNPLPWVDSVMEEEKMYRCNHQKKIFSSPPMLWQDIENRRKRTSDNRLRKTSVT